MTLNIAHKIFGIAIVGLTLMAIVAAFSVDLTAKISKELDSVATQQLPLSNTIGRINVKVLEQGILLQRLFTLPEESPEAIKRIETLGKETDAEFLEAKRLFELEEHVTHPPETVFVLHQALLTIEQEYRTLKAHSLELLALHRTGDKTAFHELLPNFNKQQTAIDDGIAALHSHLESAADKSIVKADEEEKYLLLFNSSMTVLAGILGLSIATLVTSALVRNVRNLVRAAEDVEQGNLDTEVPIVTRDEVGKLSNSFNEMVDGLRTKERIKETFGKYMDPRIVAKLLEYPEFIQLGGQRRTMTVMFVDLKDYTTISENLSPSDLVELINMFLSRMAEAVSANSGVVNDFMGDAVMAYWGRPFIETDDHAALACQSALDAVSAFEQFRADVLKRFGNLPGGLDLGMRIGISSGDMIAGNIGSATSRKYSVIGDPVNLGARLEGANKNYGTCILMSEQTHALVGMDFSSREIDLIRVKGKNEPTRIFELLSETEDFSHFKRALNAYRQQNWDIALADFERAQTAKPDDPVPATFVKRIEGFQARPPARDWDGVWDFETK